jgi:hypothetical protein
MRDETKAAAHPRHATARYASPRWTVRRGLAVGNAGAARTRGTGSFTIDERSVSDALAAFSASFGATSSGC